MLTLHFRNCLADAIGVSHGLMEPELYGLQPRLNDAQAALDRQSSAGKLGYLDLPRQTEPAAAIQSWARRAGKRFDTLVVLGIGGSALGAQALLQALRPASWNELAPAARRGAMRVFFLDNADPDATAALAAQLNLRKTLFNVVSKSGGTAETLAGYFYFRHRANQAVGPKKAKEHFVFTTDPRSGYLREQAQKESIESFEIPPEIGGRYSVLSAVGLLPAAAAGLRLADLLAGAQAMALRCRTADLRKNPAALFAAIQYLFVQKGVRQTVFMPYAQGLRGAALWLRQLWAESLGKKSDRSGREIHQGVTPIDALGATDQHSQLQLYLEGPFDKLLAFISVDRWATQAKIPAVDPAYYLAGRTFNELMKAEERATRAALTRAGRPNVTLRLPGLEAGSLGELFMFSWLAASYLGELLNINVQDEAGIERVKVYAYALMGRAGFEAQQAELAREENSGINETYAV